MVSKSADVPITNLPPKLPKSTPNQEPPFSTASPVAGVVGLNAARKRQRNEGVKEPNAKRIKLAASASPGVTNGPSRPNQDPKPTPALLPGHGSLVFGPPTGVTGSARQTVSLPDPAIVALTTAALERLSAQQIDQNHAGTRATTMTDGVTTAQDTSIAEAATEAGAREEPINSSTIVVAEVATTSRSLDPPAPELSSAPALPTKPNARTSRTRTVRSARLLRARSPYNLRRRGGGKDSGNGTTS